jgi:small-conductance mechanosensitive channel
MGVKETILLYLKKSWIYVVIALTPLFPAFIAVGMLIVIDFFVAIYVSWKLKETITSRKMSQSISKFLLYNAAILSGFLCETYLLKEIGFVRIILGLIAIVEFKSISESINRLLGLDLWTALKNAFRRNIDSLTKPEDKK